MGLWVLLLLRCSTFTVLSDVGHITHTCTQHSHSSVSPSLYRAPPSSGSSYLLVLPLVVSPQTDRHCLHRCCRFLRKRTGCLGTLTQNLKAMGLWVLLLLRCSTFTVLSDVGHITHTCTQHSHSSVSPSLYRAPPSSGSSYLLVLPLVVSPQTDRHCLHRCCRFLRKRTGCLGRTLHRTGL